MSNIVIIGAGLTGLSAAYHLEKRGFFDYKIFEKEPTVGGLCRSIHHDGFTFDYTGHLLHAADPYFRSFIEEVVGMDNLNTIYRESFIYSHNVYTRYPFQINLFGLPDTVIAECIEGFAQRKKPRNNPRSFHAWVLDNFGTGIANHFFFPFQKKIFSYDLKKVSPTWMGRFVPSTSLQQMIKGAVKDTFDTSIGYNSQFFYPKQGGIQFWIDKIKQCLQNTIFTKYEVETIDLKNKVIFFANGHEEQFDHLITTMPLDHLIPRLQEKPSTSFNHALKNLVCNSVVNFNIGIARPNLTTKHWIYFPEEKFPFYRIGFPHNFANKSVPEGCSSLYGEFSYINKSARSVKTMLAQAMTETKKLLNIEDAEIITEKVISIPHAYVIYNFWREKYLPTLLQSLAEQHIHSIGRYGGWKYSSMQEAVLDGKKIAETLTILPAIQTFYRHFDIPTTHSQKENQ